MQFSQKENFKILFNAPLKLDVYLLKISQIFQ